MTLPPRLRKLVLTAHVTTSIGWLGALLAYIALDIIAVTGQDVRTVSGAYVAMDAVVSAAIVPLALATVVIGVINALGTQWGLFRHYWVVAKLMLTLVAAAVLLVEVRVVGRLADRAAAVADPRELPGTLPHSVGGLLVLLAAVILSIYKPRGTTRYGWRKQQLRRQA